MSVHNSHTEGEQETAEQSVLAVLANLGGVGASGACDAGRGDPGEVLIELAGPPASSSAAGSSAVTCTPDAARCGG